jgi:streptomycin 3"-adenylyltransferase
VDAVLGCPPDALVLHGSLALGDFDPTRSDLDLLLVTAERPAASVIGRLAAVALELSRAPYPVELSGVAARELAGARHPYPFWLHYGEDWREVTERWLATGEPPDLPAGDPDLAMHFVVARARGRSLTGRPPRDVLPEPAPDEVLDALVRDWLWAVAPERSIPAYAILNRCRALRYLTDGAVLSKIEGGRWALERRLADPAAVAWALAAYRGHELPAPPDPAAFFHRTDALLTERLGCGAREWLSGMTGGEG